MKFPFTAMADPYQLVEEFGVLVEEEVNYTEPAALVIPSPRESFLMDDSDAPRPFPAVYEESTSTLSRNGGVPTNVAEESLPVQEVDQNAYMVDKIISVPRDRSLEMQTEDLHHIKKDRCQVKAEAMCLQEKNLELRKKLSKALEDKAHLKQELEERQTQFTLFVEKQQETTDALNDKIRSNKEEKVVRLQQIEELKGRLASQERVCNRLTEEVRVQQEQIRRQQEEFRVQQEEVRVQQEEVRRLKEERKERNIELGVTHQVDKIKTDLIGRLLVFLVAIASGLVFVLGVCTLPD